MSAAHGRVVKRPPLAASGGEDARDRLAAGSRLGEPPPPVERGRPEALLLRSLSPTDPRPRTTSLPPTRPSPLAPLPASWAAAGPRLPSRSLDVTSPRLCRSPPACRSSCGGLCRPASRTRRSASAVLTSAGTRSRARSSSGRQLFSAEHSRTRPWLRSRSPVWSLTRTRSRTASHSRPWSHWRPRPLPWSRLRSDPRA